MEFLPGKGMAQPILGPRKENPNGTNLFGSFWLKSPTEESAFGWFKMVPGKE